MNDNIVPTNESQTNPDFLTVGEVENDFALGVENNEINEVEIKNDLNFMLTNARSLAPKVDSFLENFTERNIDICVVTETWLHDEMGLLQDEGVNFDLGEGIGVVHRGLSLIHI